MHGDSLSDKQQTRAFPMASVVYELNAGVIVLWTTDREPPVQGHRVCRRNWRRDRDDCTFALRGCSSTTTRPSVDRAPATRQMSCVSICERRVVTSTLCRRGSFGVDDFVG